MYFANAARGQALTHLKVLDLNDNAIETGGMEILVSVLEYLPNLIELHLSRNKIEHAGAKALSGAIGGKLLSNVHKLSLNHNKIGNEGMQDLWVALSTRKPPMIYVYLNDNNITSHRESTKNVRFVF